MIFRFQLIEPDQFTFSAGQYMMLLVPQPDGLYLRRLYSIASSTEDKKTFELLIKLVEGGAAGEYLKNIKVGDSITFNGPAGIFTLKESPRKKILMATGCGIAPIRSILLSNSEFKIQNSEFYLFWGMKHYDEIYLLEELMQLTNKNGNSNFFLCLSREQNKEKIPAEYKDNVLLGHIDQGLEQVLSANFLKDTNLANYDYYLCGSRTVIESQRLYLAQKGIPKEQIFFEKF